MATEFKEERWANLYAEGIKIGDLTGEINILETEAGSGTTLDDLEQELKTINEQLKELQVKLDPITEKINKIREEIEALGETVETDAEKDLKTMENDLQAENTKRTPSQNKIDTLTKKIETQKTIITKEQAQKRLREDEKEDKEKEKEEEKEEKEEKEELEDTIEDEEEKIQNIQKMIAAKRLANSKKKEKGVHENMIIENNIKIEIANEKIVDLTKELKQIKIDLKFEQQQIDKKNKSIRQDQKDMIKSQQEQQGGRRDIRGGTSWRKSRMSYKGSTSPGGRRRGRRTTR